MSPQEDIHWLKIQVVELQSQLAFQEDLVQALNDVVTRQQKQLEHLHELLQDQKQQLDGVVGATGSGGDAEKPPHY